MCQKLNGFSKLKPQRLTCRLCYWLKRQQCKILFYRHAVFHREFWVEPPFFHQIQIFPDWQGEPIRISPKLSCRTSRQRVLSASHLLVKQKVFAVAQENLHPFNLEFVGPSKNQVMRRERRVSPSKTICSFPVCSRRSGELHSLNCTGFLFHKLVRWKLRCEMGVTQLPRKGVEPACGPWGPGRAGTIQGCLAVGCFLSSLEEMSPQLCLGSEHSG